MKKYSLRRRIKIILDGVLSGLFAIIFGLMFLLGLYQIITRYLLNAPSKFSEELLTYLFVWMIMLATAFIFGRREHMRMSFIADKIGGVPRRILETGIELLIVAFAFLVMVAGGFFITDLTSGQLTASLGVPMSTVYVIIPISGILILIYSILNFIDIWTLDVDKLNAINLEAIEEDAKVD